jgi:hypothetical protein
MYYRYCMSYRVHNRVNFYREPHQYYAVLHLWFNGARQKKIVFFISHEHDMSKQFALCRVIFLIRQGNLILATNRVLKYAVGC